jgi:hypothetical protein
MNGRQHKLAVELKPAKKKLTFTQRKYKAGVNINCKQNKNEIMH